MALVSEEKLGPAFKRYATITANEEAVIKLFLRKMTPVLEELKKRSNLPTPSPMGTRSRYGGSVDSWVSVYITPKGKITKSKAKGNRLLLRLKFRIAHLPGRFGAFFWSDSIAFPQEFKVLEDINFPELFREIYLKQKESE